MRHGKTIGSPIAIEIVNRDWKNWEEKLPVEAGDPGKHQAVASPRPGHADLAGALKYNFPDARYVLERASARESTARVAAGAFAKLLLRDLGIEVCSHVIRVGRVELERPATWEEIAALSAERRDRAELRGCRDRSAHEGRGEAGLPHRRHRRRRLRSGGARGAGRPGHLRQLGRAPGRAAGLVGDEPAGGEGGGDRARRYGGGVVRLDGA